MTFPIDMDYVRHLGRHWKSLVIIITPLILLPVIVIGHTAEFRCAYVILIMAVYWITEVLPLAITALIPVIGFPALGIVKTKAVCVTYLKDTNVVFLGALMMATALEHCNLHKRIALFVLQRLGQSPKRLLAGFMLITTFLSMWISNVATAAMMVPIVESVVREIEQTKDLQSDSQEAEADGVEEPHEETSFIESRERKDHEEVESSEYEEPAESSNVISKRQSNSSSPVSTAKVSAQTMNKMLFLGVAFASNIGGTGSPLGCGPNVVMFSILQSSFGDGTGLTFGTWMGFNIPGMIVCAILGWCWLLILCKQYRPFGKKGKTEEFDERRQRAIKKFLQNQYQDLGPISQHELVVFVSFVVLVVLWVFRNPGSMNGWAHHFGKSYENRQYIHEATPVILIVFLLFVIPRSFKLEKDEETSEEKAPEGCLNWKVIHEKTPWDIILLSGGGLAMAEASKKSGLSRWLGRWLQQADYMPKGTIAFLACLFVAMLTELASDTAMASIFLPILKDLALAIGANPIYLMLPAAVSCAYAFMLPIATPGNAIVLRRSGLKMHEMIWAGFVMNILCVITITFMINTLGRAVFDLDAFPDWAKNASSLIPSP